MEGATAADVVVDVTTVAVVSVVVEEVLMVAAEAAEKTAGETNPAAEGAGCCARVLASRPCKPSTAAIAVGREGRPCSLADTVGGGGRPAVERAALASKESSLEPRRPTPASTEAERVAEGRGSAAAVGAVRANDERWLGGPTAETAWRRDDEGSGMGASVAGVTGPSMLAVEGTSASQCGAWPGAEEKGSGSAGEGNGGSAADEERLWPGV